jgi:hypothetical protein
MLEGMKEPYMKGEQRLHPGLESCRDIARRLVTRHLEFSIKRGVAWSRSTLLHQRGGALADFLKRPFETAKFF